MWGVRGWWAGTSGSSSWFLLSWFTTWRLCSASPSTVASSSPTSGAAGRPWLLTAATRKRPLCSSPPPLCLPSAGYRIMHSSLSMSPPISLARQRFLSADLHITCPLRCLRSIWPQHRLDRLNNHTPAFPCGGRWPPWWQFYWCVWLPAGTHHCTSCCHAQLCASSELCCLPSSIRPWPERPCRAGALHPLLLHACRTGTNTHSLTHQTHTRIELAQT